MYIYIYIYIHTYIHTYTWIYIRLYSNILHSALFPHHISVYPPTIERCLLDRLSDRIRSFSQQSKPPIYNGFPSLPCLIPGVSLRFTVEDD